MRKIIISAVAIALVGVLGVGCGEDDEELEIDEIASFDDLDLDGDNAISAAEWDLAIADWDVDDDGFLDDNEFLEDDGAFDDVDFDDDAILSDAEWDEAFDELDDDDDGFIDDDEFF